MVSTIDVDFLFSETGEPVRISNQVLPFPPIYPTDMACKKYVISTFDNDWVGSLYSGPIDFTNTPNTPLYGTTIPPINVNINRVGNNATLSLGGVTSIVMTYNGAEIIGTGLPQEFWPAPVLPGDSGYEVTTPMYIASGATHNNRAAMGYIGIGSDGLIRIGLLGNEIWYQGNDVTWHGATFSYSIWRGAAAVAKANS